MKILKFFKRKKEKKEEKKAEVVRQPSELELICGDDHKVYEALERTLLLNIRSLSSKEFSIEETLNKARAKEEVARAAKGEAEKKDLLYDAGLEYHFAGQIALTKIALSESNGDIEPVELEPLKEFFGKAQELTGRPYPILNILEGAVKKAQEYYQEKKEGERQKK